MAQTLAELNASDRAAFEGALGRLFEHSPWVAGETHGRGPFKDAAHLHRELAATLRRASPERQMAVIRAHPDLAGRLAQAGALTAESAREQASAGLNALAPADAAELQRLNAAYLGKFGFPFIICARLNAKDAILEALRRRLGNTPGEEREAAIAEIEKIAWLRLCDELKP